MDISDQASLAISYINTTQRHVFLTGKAGTGKTTFLLDLKHRTHKRFIVVAPTGIAALNASGVTIHSQFLLPFGSFIPERDPSGSFAEGANVYTQHTLSRKHTLNSARKQVLRDIDLLVIDEVSMLRADVLDAIDFRLRSARRDYHTPFGGVQLLLIGDLYQLPPIVKDEEWKYLSKYYTSAHFFDALGLHQAGFVYVELDKIYRQQDDHFIRILNNLRNNCPTKDDIELLNAHFKTPSQRESMTDIITLTTHNYRADDINQKELQKLPGKPHVFKAEIAGDFKEFMYPVRFDLELKVGAQIMFIKNDTQNGRYFNGKLAKVVAIKDKQVSVIMEGESESYTLTAEKWENKKYTIDPDTKELDEEVVGTFVQLPVKLAWAITVHKSQGLTFDKAIIDVGQAFAPGQVYVALSRLRSLDGLTLGTRIDPKTVSTDAEVVTFQENKVQGTDLRAELHIGQREYLENILNDSFDFSTEINQIDMVLKSNDLIAQFEEESMRTALPKLREQLHSQQFHLERFRLQLQRIIRTEEKQVLFERLAKAADYYERVLRECLLLLMMHIEEVMRLSKTKAYGTDLSELDLMLWRRCERMFHSEEIVKGILNGSSLDVLNSERIRTMRTELTEMVQASMASRPLPKGRKTGRAKKRNLDGAEAKPKKEKGQTYNETYALHEQGLSLQEIADKRSMALTTIEGHMARGIAEGTLPAEAFLHPDQLSEIGAKLVQPEAPSITQLMAHFQGRYTYGQLRMAMAHKTWQEGKRD